LNPCRAFDHCWSAEAIELLAVDADDVAKIAVQAQNGAKDVVESASCSRSETEIKRITIGLT